MPLTYTPSAAVSQGGFPGGLTTPNGVTWDGQQLVIADNTGDELFRLQRNMNGSYTAANASTTGAGSLPSDLTQPTGLAWDGMQLVILDDSDDSLWTLARNTNGTYSPANAVRQGELTGINAVTAIAWDGQQLVIGAGRSLYTLARDMDGGYTPANNSRQSGETPQSGKNIRGLGWDGGQLVVLVNGQSFTFDSLLTLARNANGTYSPANAANQGDFASGLPNVQGGTWDGLQVLIVDHQVDQLWRLAADAANPIVDSISANPTIIDHAGSSMLAAVASDPNPGDTLTYQWVSDSGGMFGDNMAASTTWTASSSDTTAHTATLTVTVTDSTGRTAMASVSVTVRGQVAPLALPAIPNKAGATGDVVDVLITPAMNGRAPYTYTYAGLPPELEGLGRRIRGRLIAPGVFPVMATVTDANGDTATRAFAWTVTGDAILPPAGVNVRIDWGQASYSDPNADVTGRIRSGIRCKRGKAVATAALGKTEAGILQFELDNSDGLYDQENTNSALSGLVRAGIKVQLRDGGTPLWSGEIYDIPTKYAENGQHRAMVTAYGIFYSVRDSEAQDGNLSSETTAQAFMGLLEPVGVCGVAPDASYATMPRWWELGRLRDGLRNLEDTEGGFIYEDRLGNLGLQSASHRAGQALAATFTTEKNPVGQQIRIFGRPQREIAAKDVVKTVVGAVREYAPMAGQTVFEREEPIAIGLGQTISIFSDFQGIEGDPGAIVSLDSTIAFTANAAADGSGANRTAALAVSASIGQFNEVELQVTYATGQGFTDTQVYLTSVTVRGTVLLRLQPTKVTRTSATSLGRRTLRLGNTWIHNAATMGARAAALLAALATPETRVTLRWVVEDYATFAGLELSDRIAVQMPGYFEMAFIESIALDIPLDGVRPVCTLQTTVEV